jgi:hypothetical protein
VEQAHEPADSKECQKKATKAVEAVPHPRLVGALRHQTEHDASDQCEEKRNLKMVEAKVHGDD